MRLGCSTAATLDERADATCWLHNGRGLQTAVDDARTQSIALPAVAKKHSSLQAASKRRSGECERRASSSGSSPRSGFLFVRRVARFRARAHRADDARGDESENRRAFKLSNARRSAAPLLHFTFPTAAGCRGGNRLLVNLFPRLLRRQRSTIVQHDSSAWRRLHKRRRLRDRLLAGAACVRAGRRLHVSFERRVRRSADESALVDGGGKCERVGRASDALDRPRLLARFSPASAHAAMAAADYRRHDHRVSTRFSAHREDDDRQTIVVYRSSKLMILCAFSLPQLF